MRARKCLFKRRCKEKTNYTNKKIYIVGYNDKKIRDGVHISFMNCNLSVL